MKWACHAGLLPAVGRNDQQSVITFHRQRDTGQVPADCLAELQRVTTWMTSLHSVQEDEFPYPLQLATGFIRARMMMHGKPRPVPFSESAGFS